MQIAFSDTHGKKDRIVLLILWQVVLLLNKGGQEKKEFYIKRISDTWLAKVSERVDVEAAGDVRNVCEEIKHILMEVETEARLVQLSLIQDVLVLKV